MAEPITLAQAKAQCRIRDDTTEDALLTAYIVAAREWIEKRTGHILVQRAIVERHDEFGSYIVLASRPISTDSVEIEYLDTDGATQSYADFVAQTDRDPARLYPEAGAEWPDLFEYGGVTVTYTAGYAAGSEPQPLLQAMLLLIGHWFKNREAVTANQPYEVPLAVEALCAPYWTPVL